jgi:tetratricopeptide (TPR) repeat protein
LDVAIALAPEETEFFRIRADLHFGLAAYARAIEDYNVFLLDNANDFLTFIRRGECYARLEIYSGAIEDYSRALALKPRADWFFDRGFFNMQLKKYADAQIDFEKAISLKVADQALAKHNLGICLFFLGAKQDACKQWQEAGEISNEFWFKYCTSEE